MADTELKTVFVPRIVGDGSPEALNPGPVNVAYAMGRWLRVLVANISNGVDVIIGLSTSDLREVPPSTQTFLLQAGKSEVFPLAPGQKLYASTAGDGAKISACISDALPVDVSVR